MENLMQGYYRQISRQLEERKNKEFESKLAELGFIFSDNDERNRFCSTRLSELSFEDKHPDYRELWLDHGTDNGVLICSYWDRYDIEFNASGDQINVKVTWNNPPARFIVS